MKWAQSISKLVGLYKKLVLDIYSIKYLLEEKEISENNDQSF